MRLLILTQKVDKNDSVLGFFHSWIAEFSKHFEKVIVVCLEKGTYNLPNNVSVFSLGKEGQRSNVKCHTLKRVQYVAYFIRYIVRKRNEYDAVFVHMNPEYVVLGGLFWRLWHKKITLWYVHRQINVRLWLAEKLSHMIFSTSPEAFRLKSKKVYFLGHGINFSLFPRKTKLWTSDVQSLITIVHVGRITPIKNLDILIEAAAILKRVMNKELRIKIAGEPATTGDAEYEQRLKEMAKKLGLEDAVSFTGNVPFTQIGELYREADVSINLTPTGGMDKAVLESIASGTIALSANKAFKDLFGEYADYLLYNERDTEDTANKITAIIDMGSSERRKIENYLYERVLIRFNLGALIKRIVQEIKTL